MPYTSPGEAIGEGFKSGMSLVAGFHEMKAKREQQKYENNYKDFEVGAKMYDRKGLSPSGKAAAYKMMKNGWDKNHPDEPLPVYSPGTAEHTDSMVQNISSIITDMRKKPGDKGYVDGKTGLGMIVQNGQDAWKNIQDDADSIARHQAVVKPATDYAKEVADAQAKDAEAQDKKGKAGTDDQDYAHKRSTDLGLAFGQLMKTGTIDSESIKKDPTLAPFAGMFDKGKLSPEETSALGTIINHERAYLNTKIQDSTLRTPVMYGEEYKAAIAAGYKPQDLQLSHIIMPGTNPKGKGPAAAPVIAPGAVAPRPVIAPAPVPMAPPPVTPNLMGASPAPVPVAPPQKSLTGPVAPMEPDAGYLG